MLTKSEAKKLVEKNAPEDGAICYERAHLFGWVFVFQSKEYLVSGDYRDMWVGNGPVLVNRFTGNVHQFGSHRATSHFVWRYQLKWIGIIIGSLYFVALVISGLM